MKKRAVFLVICLIFIFAAGCGQENLPGPPSASASQASASVTAPEDPSSQPVQSDWTLEVDSTINTKINGYDLKCTLTVYATKQGGTDELGLYGGEATLKYSYDMSSGGVAGNAQGEGEDGSVVIDITPYDPEKYADSQGDASALAPLVEYDAMALGSFNVTGAGISNESAGGADWSKQESKSVAVPFKMTILGGQVEIELPSLAPGNKFTGILTGVPN